MVEAIRNESTSPPLAARNLAILHTSIYDAVNAIDGSHQAYFISLNAPPGASVDAAAVGAAYECLSYLYPSQSASFENALNEFLSNTLDTTNRANGLELGQTVAYIILDWRSDDGSSTAVNYVPGSDPGEWRRTPPFFRPPELPQWPYVIPFALTNGAQYRPPGPPSLVSSQYAADLNQVKAIGALNSTNRTAEQTQIAKFWSDFSFTVTPPGHWNQIAQNIATNRANTLVQNARMFALLNIAMADAGIVVWDAKYAYNFWRPVTAIQQAATDGNPATEADPNWLPLLTTPSFPEYVSGHSTFSAAAATILTRFYGTDQVSFSIGSDALPGVIRSYTSLSSAAQEIGMSRIYGGIHYLTSDLDGLDAGQKVGNYVTGNFLRSLNEPPILALQLNQASKQLQILLTGIPGLKYVLEISQNLKDWTPVATNSAPFTYSDTISANPQFYRAIGTK